MTPADRYFEAAPTVLQTLRERVATNALELARQGTPRPPFYMTGQVAGQAFSVHAEGERVFLTRPGQPRQEVELVGPPSTDEATAAAPPPLPEPLSEPLCPQGVPESDVPVVKSSPGVSWYETAPALAGADAPQPTALASRADSQPHDDVATGGAP